MAAAPDLAKVNQLTLGYRPTLQFLDGLATSGRLPKDRTLTIVDVGGGFGDMLRKIDCWTLRLRLSPRQGRGSFHVLLSIKV